jgi:archaellum component FlaF (FlaF/FlaG flagellin family)
MSNVTPNTRSLVIIGAYPKTEYSVEVLKKTITILKDDFDILLATHYPADKDIQQMISYYVYDHRNDVINNESDYYIFFQSYDTFYFQNKEKRDSSNYHYAVYRNIINSLMFAKNYYEDFYYIESDSVFHKEDLEKFKKLKQDSLTQQKNACFFAREDNFFHTTVFWSEIEYFLKAVPFLRTAEDFITITKGNNCIEHFISNAFYRYDSFKSTHLLLNIHPAEYFYNSKLDQLTSDNQYMINNCRVLLLRDVNSNNIFFVCSEGGDVVNIEMMTVKIDGILIFEKEVNRNKETTFIQVFPTSDTIHMEVNGITRQYSVESIINNTDSFIRFNN